MFIKNVVSGKKGLNTGLSSGFERLDRLTNNIQKKSINLIGAQPKTGKTTFVDARYVIEPFLKHREEVEKGNIRWIYYSYEIDRTSKMAKFAAYFMWHRFKIRCDPNYILSRGDHEISEEHLERIRQIYEEDLVPLFGRVDDNGNLVEQGAIMFHEDKQNPTGIRNELIDYASKNGKIRGETFNRIVGYEPNNPDLHTIVIMDHVGLMRKERGFNKKDNLDKFSEYCVKLRNTFHFTFVLVSQFNRGLGKIERLRFSGQDLQPSLEDFKDTGNLAEDANLVIGLFNPNIYHHLDEHMHYPLRTLNKMYRSAHILANRDGPAGSALPLVMDHATGKFIEIPHYSEKKQILEIGKELKSLPKQFTTEL